MNPAMSSWVALRRRVPLQPGQSVLVLGATGNAGTMAVQVAKRLGAGRVIGAGRNAERLAGLPSVSAPTRSLHSPKTRQTPPRAWPPAAAEVDVVIDYLWGEPAATAMMALLKARSDRSRAMDWIQIGAIAGTDHRTAFRCAARRQPPDPGQRPRGGVNPRPTSRSCRPWSARSTRAPSPSTSAPVALADVEAAWRHTDPPGNGPSSSHSPARSYWTPVHSGWPGSPPSNCTHTPVPTTGISATAASDAEAAALTASVPSTSGTCTWIPLPSEVPLLPGAFNIPQVVAASQGSIRNWDQPPGRVVWPTSIRWPSGSRT